MQKTKRGGKNNVRHFAIWSVYPKKEKNKQRDYICYPKETREEVTALLNDFWKELKANNNKELKMKAIILPPKNERELWKLYFYLLDRILG